MNPSRYSHEQLLNLAKLSAEDLAEVNRRRRPHNRLGFAYQVAFGRLANRFPTQQPFEIDDELLTFVSLQLDGSALDAASWIQLYTQRQSTLSGHQEQIRIYLGLRRFGEPELRELEQFLFEESCRLEQTGPLLTRAKQFLQEAGILYPADDTLRRLIIRQRQLAREHIFARISDQLTSEVQEKLDALLTADAGHRTPFQSLKQPPGRASPTAMLRLADKLAQIQTSGHLTLDLVWLNNNYQRSLDRYARRCSADRLRNLQPAHRYAVLVCFLGQLYRDTIDHMVDMHDKLMTSVHSRAQAQIDEQTRQRRVLLQTSLRAYRAVGRILLDNAIAGDAIRDTVFTQVTREDLAHHLEEIDTWLNGKYSHALHLVVQRFSYLRQFAPALLHHLTFHFEEGSPSSLVEAIYLLRDLNLENKRKLPEDAPIDFIPESLRSLVEREGEVDKRAWECVLLTALRDEIRAGNVFVEQSKRFGHFDNFFIVDTEWASLRESFFQRAGLPVQAEEVPAYLTDRLNRAYDRFLALLPENTYASIDEGGW